MFLLKREKDHFIANQDKKTSSLSWLAKLKGWVQPVQCGNDNCISDNYQLSR